MTGPRDVPSVAWIHVATVKGLAVEERRHVLLGPRGVEDDRRYCIVDADTGAMVNAKRVPAFVAVRPSFADGRLTLEMPDGRLVAGEVVLAGTVPITIFRRAASARDLAGPWSEALSHLAGRPLRLVRLEQGEGVDRADLGGAATILSQASLEALGRAAGVEHVDARRFRMLFGVAGVPAHSEDGWMGRRVRLGGAVVVPTGNVGRCAVTTIDPDSGRTDLDTLDAIQRYRGDVATSEALPFGVWARVQQPGEVAVGDAVELES